jgi:hypothetical protein
VITRPPDYHLAGTIMKTITALIATIALLGAPLRAQEPKPVPKDSLRVFIPGCSKGYVFTVGRRTTDEPGTVDIAEGVHLRMNGPKKLLSEIKAHEGSMIEIAGVMKKGQYGPAGVSIGNGIRIAPGTPPTAGSGSRGSIVNQIMIDVEGWRQVPGSCPARTSVNWR